MNQPLTTTTQAGHILAARRRALGLSQRALAAKLGISQNRLSQLEANPARLTLDRLLALSNILGLDLSIRTRRGVNARAEW